MFMKVNVINFIYIHVLCPFINCNRILNIMINYVHKYRNWRNNINSHISFVLDLFQQSALWSQLHVNKYIHYFLCKALSATQTHHAFHIIHTKKPTHFVKYLIWNPRPAYLKRNPRNYVVNEYDDELSV